MNAHIQSLPDIRELKGEIIAGIIRDFGITKAAFFIRETIFQKIDYLETKDRLFGEKSAKELYAEITDWKKCQE